MVAQDDGRPVVWHLWCAGYNCKTSVPWVHRYHRNYVKSQVKMTLLPSCSCDTQRRMHLQLTVDPHADLCVLDRFITHTVFGHGQLDQMIMNAVASDPVPGTGIDDTSVSRQLHKTNLGKRMRKLGTISYRLQIFEVMQMYKQIQIRIKLMFSCNR